SSYRSSHRASSGLCAERSHVFRRSLLAVEPHVQERALQGKTRLMNAALRPCRSILIASSVAAIVVVLGCGDDSGLAKRYPVSGTVKYKGELVPTGTIAFEPTNPAPPQGRHASGYIENGSYTLTTANEGDGALPGEYKVVIISSGVDMRELAKKSGGMVR